MHCENCEPIPPEPPVGTWMRDRFGGTTMRQEKGWGEPGIMPFGRWEAMWRRRGPYVECGPWGAPLEPELGLMDEAHRLPLVGRERVMIENLTKILHAEIRRHYNYAPIREIPRGNTFEVRLADRRVAKITVELDRVEEQ